MWYVSEMHITTIDGKSYEKGCLLFSDVQKRKAALNLTLRNTESRETVYLTNHTPDKLCAQLDEYGPYGIVAVKIANDKAVPDRNSQPSTAEDILFVKVDDLSIQCLDYVDSIGPLRGSDVLKRIKMRQWKPSFHFWDRNNTLVEFDKTNAKCVCTLLQLLCFLKEGWKDDKFYFGARGTGFCIKFNDVGSARALVDRAIAGGYNPMQDYAKQLMSSDGKD